jgi:hypothetical protein
MNGSSPNIDRLLERFGSLLLLPLVVGAWTVMHHRAPVVYPVDALPTYLAAKLYSAGHLDAVYHPTVWPTPEEMHPAWQEQAKQLGIAVPSTSFIYGPLYLLLAWPIASLLSLKAFLWSLTLANAACATFIGRSSARLAGIEQVGQQLGIAFLVALSFPCAYAALLGQNVLLAAALVLAAFMQLSRGGNQRWWAVALLVLACVLKPWCVSFFGVLLLLRQLGLFVAASGAYLLLVQALPRWLLPEALVSGYDQVVARVMQSSVLAYNNVSVRALIERWTTPEWPQLTATWAATRQTSTGVLIAEACSVLAVGLIFAWLCWSRRPRAELAGATAMAVALFALSVCWSHYLVFALPLVVIVAFGKYPIGLRLLAAGAGLWLLKLMVVYAPVPTDLRPRWSWALTLTMPLLLTTALALLTLWRAPSRSTPRSAHSSA